jgi:protein gp37
MAANSSIEWTEMTWNPVTGCTKVSPGCMNCYAERMAKRLRGMGVTRYESGFKVTLQPDLVEQPLRWRKPRLVFVNSMSDLFHEDVPFEFIEQVFDVMRRASWHQFQVLTKRSERLQDLDASIEWPENVWMGVSVENDKYAHRVDNLRKTGAKIRFLSLEPLLGPIPGISLKGVDWVIVGGESGPGARPIEEAWVWDIQKQCKRAGVHFFCKQWGGFNKKKNGRILKDRTWDAMPVVV